MFLDSGDLDRAYPHLTKMEEIEPDSVVGNYLMARYSFARKDFEQARTYAERVELSRPANSELRGLLGSIYQALGKKQDAMREYEIAVRLAPGRADFQDALGRIRSQEAQGKPAITKP
jgi:predicted Zn-dependent protease